MFVKSMVIDGFKSYGQRVEVNGFDPLFNAITGLNGSGKSNILDAICFVLGISNLSQVRAKDLQDLVYKNGQAGVVKATVSITFDNKDKNQSPVGYDHYDEISVTRQVVVGGKNKYLINGCNAQNSRVQDLFRSVQLNVNNPHFLIMQGRITKVLNMKPPEILSMIEEAAGTKMYETKKQNAQKTIEKKDAKLKEIETILNEEITPTLSKLKEERASYLEYQKVQRELEYLNKLVVAYQFVSAQESSDEAVAELEKLKDVIREMQDSIAKDKQNIKEIENQIEHLHKKKSMEEDGKLEQLDAALKAAQAVEAKASSALNSNKENIKAEEKKNKDLQKNQDEDSAAAQSKEREIQQSTGLLAELQEKCQQDSDLLRQAQDKFQAVSAGLCSNEDGAEATLADQLMAAKSEIATAETEKKQSDMKLKQARADINTKKKELHITEKEYHTEQAALKKLQQELAKIEGEMSKLHYNEEEAETLVERRQALSKEVSSLAERLEFLQSRNPHLVFDYKDPERNFDRRKVLGVMAGLVSVKDMSTATALEMVAGGKLYNVVVDTEETGKKLLNSGDLRRRVTFIPLNKITGPTIPRDVVTKAERLVGKENVSPAVSLVEFPPRLESAMRFVFGNAFVCPNMDTAKQVAFHEGIQRKTVTLEGESFDPAGTLSGGSRQSAPVLAQAIEINKLRGELEQKEAELETVAQRLKDMQGAAGKFRQMKQQLMLKQHEAELLQNKLQQSRHQQQLEEVEALQQSIKSCEEALVRCEEVRKNCSGKVKELETKLKNVQATREQELKAAEKQVEVCKKRSEESSKMLKEKQMHADTLKLEVEDLQKTLTTCTEQMNAIDLALQAYQEKATKLTESLQNAKEDVRTAQKEVLQQKDLLKVRSQEIQEYVKKRDNLDKGIRDGEYKMKEIEHTRVKLTTTARESADRVKYLLSHHDWIADDSKYFGQANTAYDFEANDPVEARRRLEKLQETKDKLGKQVNMRAMNMLGKAEEQYNDLLHKKKIVEGDKKKISDVIRELDEKKKEALMAAWAQVNKDFGSIFSMLLPGTQAKLDPPEKQTVLDGLEVRVAFGNVWKESLGELSGGQRSLVALSLILAMLLFKPAPIYILDEVDAALDLSHTQNIGQMLRTHFQHSQFIVVSLKDGMFNNANVLFKTKFVDGTSTVNRFEQRQTSRGK